MGYNLSWADFISHDSTYLTLIGKPNPILEQVVTDIREQINQN